MELGSAADGREEEGFAPRVLGEISRPQLAGWMRKKETELELALAAMVEHYSDGASSSEMSKDDEKTEEEEKRRQRRLGLYNAAQKHKEAMHEPPPRQRDAKDGHDRA